ncbi:MAG: flavocytochrome c [Coriobacteriales bacterium]|jgi:urocanate reductase
MGLSNQRMATCGQREGIGRRQFVTGAAMAAGALAGAAGLAGIANASEAKASGSKDASAAAGKASSGAWAGYTPGDYSSQVMGHNAPFTVTCTFTKYALSAIDTSDNNETIGVGKVALKTISDEVIKTQSLNVDAVSGASITSAALLGGIEDCAKQAGGTDELLAESGPAQQVEDTYDADVAVVGGGGSGLCAAVSAAQAGAKVVVIEKLAIDGGSTNVSEGALNAVDPELQEKQGIEDSVPTHYAATWEGGHKTGTPALIGYLVHNALDSVHWLESIGVRFKDTIGSATGSLGQRSHYPYTPSGNTYIRSLVSWADSHPDQIMILHECDATRLLTDASGAVDGVEASWRGGEKTVTVNAKAVIIATGGFGANVEYRQSVNTGVWADVKLDDSIGCTNINPCAQGEGLKLASDAGAELIGLSDIQLHPCGTPGTGLMEDIRTSGRNRIFVNEQGDRFVNEGAARDTLCKAIFAQPDSTYWVVVNKLRYPDETTPDANGATIKNMVATGHVTAADTIEELANACGMDPAKLQASIDAYNAVIDGGTDEFGFVADNTADAKMTEGPWYACRKVPTVHHTMGGIHVDVSSRAVGADGNPIPGLYACGEVTGGIHGSNRLGGNAIADCMTFGRNAGVQAAIYAGYDEPAPAEDGSSPVGSVTIADAQAAALASPDADEQAAVDEYEAEHASK